MYPSLLISAAFYPDSWIVSRAQVSMSNSSGSKVVYVARVVVIHKAMQNRRDEDGVHLWCLIESECSRQNRKEQ